MTARCGDGYSGVGDACGGEAADVVSGLAMKMKILGFGMLTSGLLMFTSGVRHVGDPPRQAGKWYYGTSQQLANACLGPMLAVIGYYVYRTGKWPK